MSAATEARVERALLFVEQHYHRPDLMLGDVARHVGTSRFHLTRALRKHTGRRFLDHVHGARIAAAEHLLVTTTLSVKEIAANVGYNDSTQLCRHFRRVRETSPGAFRDRFFAMRATSNDEKHKSTIHCD